MRFFSSVICLFVFLNYNAQAEFRPFGGLFAGERPVRSGPVMRCNRGGGGPVMEGCGGGGVVLPSTSFSNGNLPRLNELDSNNQLLLVNQSIQDGIATSVNLAGDPVRVVVGLDSQGLQIAQALDANGSIVAQTRSFVVGTNQPFFEQSTGLRSNGFSRFNPTIQAGVVNGVVNGAVPSAEVPVSTTTGATTGTGRDVNDIGTLTEQVVNGRQTFSQRRNGIDQPIEVVNRDTIAFIRVGNGFQRQLVNAGELVVRDRSGALIVLDTSVRNALVDRYGRLNENDIEAINRVTPGASQAIRQILARHKVGVGSRIGQPPVGGTHGAPGNGGTNRPVDNKVAATPYREAAEKFDKALKDTIEFKDTFLKGFIKKWASNPDNANSQTALVKVACVSPNNPTVKTPMTLLLDREKKGDAWVESLRIQNGDVDFNTAEVERDRSAGRFVKLGRTADTKALFGRREVDGDEIQHDYTLANTAVDGKPPKLAVKVNVKALNATTAIFCEQTGLKLDKANEPAKSPVPDPAKRDVTSLGEDKVPAESVQVSEKLVDAKLPALFGKGNCASCHTGKNTLNIGEHGISFLKSDQGTPAEALLRVATRMGDGDEENMVAKMAGGKHVATQAEIDEVKTWIKTALTKIDPKPTPEVTGKVEAALAKMTVKAKK